MRRRRCMRWGCPNPADHMTRDGWFVGWWCCLHMPTSRYGNCCRLASARMIRNRMREAHHA